MTDPAEIRRRGVDVAIVGAPFDDAVSHRPGRPLRPARHPRGELHERVAQLAPARPRRAIRGADGGRRRRRQRHPGLDRARPRVHLPQGPRGRRDGAIPIILGGDHSITWPSATAVAEVRRPGEHRDRPFRRPRRHRARRTGACSPGHGTPMRRLIESGAVKGKNFVQVGLRGYWPRSTSSTG